MRSAFFTGCLLAVATPSALLAASAREALSLAPVQRSEVNMDVVPDADQDKCRLEKIDTDNQAGYEVYSPTGVLLRRFVDTNDDRKLDVWSYFAGGVEIYRDIDSDFNGKADQYRWLGTAGSRWGIDDNEDLKLDRWKQISAQEVSAEVVAALAQRDADRLRRLLLTPAEMKELALGSDFERKLSDRLDRARKEAADVISSQKVVANNAKWTYFAAGTPGVVPSGTNGSKSDVTVFEGVVAMLEAEGKSAQVFVGTLVQTGSGWRMVELPIPLAENQPLTDVAGVFFTGKTQNLNEPNPRGTGQPDALVADLEKIDQQMALASQKPSELAALHARRAATLEKIAEASNGNDREVWIRQLIETLSSAASNGEYPDGREQLTRLADRMSKLQPSLQGYAKYHAIFTEYLARQSEPKPDLAKIQQWWLDQLDTFVREFPNDTQSAEALRQLGFNKEIESDEAEALKWYREAATKFPQTEAGKISGGAVRRLDSVGRTLDLKGTTIDGKNFDLRSLQGRPVIVQYWATWCEPCKQDMRLLAQLQSRYSDKKLAIVGVNIDDSKEKAQRFVKENQLSWTQLHEAGGLDSSLATQLGVQTLPMMIIIDSSGKVVRHSVQAAELDGAILKLGK